MPVLIAMKYFIILFVLVKSLMRIACGIVMTAKPVVRIVSGTVKNAVLVPGVLRCHAIIVAKSHLMRLIDYKLGV